MCEQVTVSWVVLLELLTSRACEGVIERELERNELGLIRFPFVQGGDLNRMYWLL